MLDDGEDEEGDEGDRLRCELAFWRVGGGGLTVSMLAGVVVVFGLGLVWDGEDWWATNLNTWN